LLSSESIHEELQTSSTPALGRSLSNDSKQVIEIPYGAYVDKILLGPKAKYKMTYNIDSYGYRSIDIVDVNGVSVSPDKAKIIINPKTNYPRLLFKDPDYNEWVEPESFYSYTENVFYEENMNIYQTPEGVTIEAFNAPVWHGVPCIGIKFKTAHESVIFSGDTVHNIALWKQLYQEKTPQRISMLQREFDAKKVIFGDINDYIERVWSEQRYRDALNAFDGAALFHDLWDSHSVVHTDYDKLDNTLLKKEDVIFVQSPYEMTSEWALAHTNKVFLIKDNRFYELVDNQPCPLNADIYHKEKGKLFVGYKNDKGRYHVYQSKGLIKLTKDSEIASQAPLYRVDLYEDIDGHYFPKLEDERSLYFKRLDNKVEKITFTENGSVGEIVNNCRNELW
jgi:hypothetical protein